MKPAEFVAKWSNVRNIFSLSSTAGVLDTASLACYDPFGNFRTTPTTKQLRAPGVNV